MVEIISQNAGKVLLEIYLIWKAENEVPEFNRLIDTTKLKEGELKRALKYCHEKSYIALEIVYGMGMKKMDGSFDINDITSHGIDIVEMPAQNEGIRPFNVTFNFNDEFNIDSIIKGEAKLF